MHAKLTSGARKQAQQLQRRLRRGQPAIMLSSRDMGRLKSLAELQAWCDEQGIGPSLRADGGWRFDHDMLRQIEQALHSLALAPLDAQLAETRIGRLQQGVQEYKTLGEAPLQHRILCSHRLQDSPVATIQTPERWILDMDWRQIDLSAYDGLLVVENADVFYACGTVDWLLDSEFAGYLVAYRGHDHRSKGLKELQRAWGDAPQVYFGDIDPKGLSIALQEGYSHVLLPSFAQFADSATAFHAPAEQESNQRDLADRQISLPGNHPLRAYLQVLVDGRGLRQQSVLDMALALVPTN